jgi:hypothetical protein
MLLCAGLIEKADCARLREVLAEEMTGSRLQRLTILHHRFYGVGLLRAGESFAHSLRTLDDGYGHPLFGECRIHVEHSHGFSDGLLAGRVRGMTLLP